jgi:uncharacterized membrane protein YccF (DUF307 family)
MVSQALMIVAFALFLLLHLLPAGAAIALVLIAIVPLAVCEVMQAAVVPAGHQVGRVRNARTAAGNTAGAAGH